MAQLAEVGEHLLAAAIAAPYLERDEEHALAMRWNKLGAKGAFFQSPPAARETGAGRRFAHRDGSFQSNRRGARRVPLGCRDHGRASLGPRRVLERADRGW